MIPKFNKKFNAERSAKRLANRFPGLESLGAVKADTPGDYWPAVRVTMPGALGAEDIAEINRLAFTDGFPPVMIVPALTEAEEAEIAAAGPGPIMATESGCELLPGEPVAPLGIKAVVDVGPAMIATIPLEDCEIIAVNGATSPGVVFAAADVKDWPTNFAEDASLPIPVEQFAASFPPTQSSDEAIRARREARQGAERKPRQARLFTKKTAVLNLLAAGCTNEQIRDATGWQWHTVKGFISTQRALGRKITTEMRDGIAFYKMEG